MRSMKLCFLVALLAMCSSAYASTFRFDTDPFAGTNVRNTPGRQVIGGESFINFAINKDVFEFESSPFGVAGPVHFVNDVANSLPTGGVNVVVLQTFDDDNNPLTPFGAGNAANLIANQIATPGAGFFIYFNQGLDLPRLVYSTDLSDNTADLRILARMLNLNGQIGRNAIPDFSVNNFSITTSTNAVPEPASLLLFAMGGLATYRIRPKRTRG
jgi:hypothetical protein